MGQEWPHLIPVSHHLLGLGVHLWFGALVWYDLVCAIPAEAAKGLQNGESSSSSAGYSLMADEGNLRPGLLQP